MTASNPPSVTVEIISDAICPWCWIGKHHLETAAARLADKVAIIQRWKPFELNPDMPKAGVDRSLYRTRKFGSLDYSAQLDARVAAAGKAAGLEFRHDLMRWTPNTFDCHRLIWFAGREGHQVELVEGLFRAYFMDGRNVGDAAVMAEVAAAAGLERGRVEAFLAGEEGRTEVAEELAHGRRLGVNGVPTFVIAGVPVVSGAVPPELLVRAITQAARISA
jgi:predicted DsbA family dithiol-disulfide isomerase